jgi:DNA modification methylase
VPEAVSVYLQDPDVTILQGDSLELLRGLPSGSVHMACTSPPFYGLRDYGTGAWEGGDPDCDHQKGGEPQLHVGSDGKLGRNNTNWDNRHGAFGAVCGKCGATRVDQQIGLEATPDEWVERLVGVFRELRRVLRDDGSLWLEIGDSYASGPYREGESEGRHTLNGRYGHVDNVGMSQRRSPVPAGRKPKDLIGAPWLLAFALRADGWYLRSEIIWAKPNPMPESVSDRPTQSHSRVFLLTKSPRYFYDAEAIREPQDPTSGWAKQRANGKNTWEYNDTPERVAQTGQRIESSTFGNPAGRNRRSVWTIPTQPYPEAHFATWPERLCEPMILAGTSERGVCPECGAPWERIVEGRGNGDAFNGEAPDTGRPDGAHRRNPRGGQKEWNGYTPPHTSGWRPTCAHFDAKPVPATILDPFGGAGTTAVVARRLGRKAILLELNPDYCALAARRLQQQSLFAV